MGNLINELSQKSGLSPEKAQTFVDVVVNYLKSRVPAPVAGQIDNALKPEGSITEKLGGVLGGKSA